MCDNNSTSAEADKAPNDTVLINQHKTDNDLNAVDAHNQINEEDSNLDSPKMAEIQRELDSGFRIITDIVKQNKTTCWPFMDAVDAEALGLWDYHQKIKEPMWLNKIIENFENKQYARFAEFARDFRVMVENCYRYNTTEHPISKKAKRLEMIFEGKLALLKKEVRESATVAKTSNGRFATLANENNSTMRSGRVSVSSSNGSRDAENENQGRLVYDFVRCEEAALAEDERLRGYREHKQQQTLYQQVAAAYVSSLESHESAKHIKTCHFLPEIGLFLHLTETTLKLPPLAMYNLEMSLLTPSDSLYLSKIMTSFLCTYYERSLINQRPPMLFRTWENRLKQRVEKWFEMVNKFNSYHYAAEKLLIGLDFFHAVDWKNPFLCDDGEPRSFLNFSYLEKALIIKALCDNLTTFQSIHNSISSLPCEQSRAMTLGFDASGNEYTYFPQFCGDDVRVYRHRRFGEPAVYDAPDPLVHLQSQKKIADDLPQKDVKHETKSPEEAVSLDSQIDSYDLDGSSKEGGNAVARPIENEKVEENSDLMDVSCEKSNDNDVKSCESLNDNDGKFSPSQDSNKSNANPDIDRKPESVQSETEIDVKADKSSIADADAASLVADTKDDAVNGSSDSPQSSFNILLAKSRLKNAVASSRQLKVSTPSTNKNEDSENCYDSSDAQWTPKRGTPKKKSKKKSASQTNEEPSNSPLRRSSRKRAAVNYTSLLVCNEPDNSLFDSSEIDSFSPKKRQKRAPRQRGRKKAVKTVEVEEPDEEYGSLDFEMICDNLESIRSLIAAQEEEHDKAVKNKKSKTIIRNVASLLDRLKWLLSELSPFENHLEKARFDAKIQLKREHDAILRDATAGRAIQTVVPDVDPWEEELISKNMAQQGDNASTSTPPASIYLEESDDESDRELRRSKRRPKRYESDEDFVLESDEEAPCQSTTFLYNELNESREILLGAALDELEVRLRSQATALEKMVGGGRVTRQSDFGETAQLLANERRTRQRSKKENKVFRKVLYLAIKDREFFGPSLLPLLKTDQTEIGEIVERVLAQEAIARQQKKMQREAEQRRKRDLKLEILQKNKEIQAKRRAAKKLVQKYKGEKHEVKSEESKTSSTLSTLSMWTPPKKQTIPTVTPGVSRNNPDIKKGRAENVRIRMQNGKIGQALRFPDGRVVPIMRMDNAKAVTSTNQVVTSERKPVAFHPHISLSAHRTSILRQTATLQKQNPPVVSSCSLSSASSYLSVPSHVNKSPVPTSVASKPTFVAGTSAVTTVRVAQPQPRQAIPVFRPSLPTTAVSQRLTLPSGQVINLVVKQPAVAPQPLEEKVTAKSLGRMFIDDIANDITPSSSHQSTNHVLPSTGHALNTSSAVIPTSKKLSQISTPQNQSTLVSNLVASKPFTKPVSKPLGIVSPMPIKQPNSVSATRLNSEKSQLPVTVHSDGPYLSSQPQPAYISSVIPPSRGVLNPQEQLSSSSVSSPQRLPLGMQNVAIVSQPLYQQASAQPVQFMPIVAGSVPLVQPVQYVQTVPIQVNTPVMFMAQGQPPAHVSMRTATEPPFPPSSTTAASPQSK